LTHHENTIWLSDGSSRLLVSATTLPFDWQVLDVTEGGQPLGRLNELEWVDGEIWANVWQSDRVVRIDPESGQILGDINLEGLLPRSERHADTDVLNGIARDPETGTVWVTGKRWPWLYPLSFDE
jgi:glutamine cyclotransferase